MWEEEKRMQYTNTAIITETLVQDALRGNSIHFYGALSKQTVWWWIQSMLLHCRKPDEKQQRESWVRIHPQQLPASLHTNRTKTSFIYKAVCRWILGKFRAPLDWRYESQSITCFLGCCAMHLPWLSQGIWENAKNKIIDKFIWFPLVWKIYFLYFLLHSAE